nr:MAG TPA: hypothetical protein [Bacteriophage sp.]
MKLMFQAFLLGKMRTLKIKLLEFFLFKCICKERSLLWVQRMH